MNYNKAKWYIVDKQAEPEGAWGEPLEMFDGKYCTGDIVVAEVLHHNNGFIHDTEDDKQPVWHLLRRYEE